MTKRKSRKLPFLQISCLLASAILPFTSASGETLLQDDFENYSSDDELDAAWPRLGNARTHLATDPKNRSNTVMYSKGDRRTRTFPTVIPTDEQPLRVTVDYFDEHRGDLPGREYLGLWATMADARGFIEVGMHHYAGSSANRLTARVLRDEMVEADWFDLNTKRERGWRRIQLWIFTDTVEIYVDGNLDTVVEWVGGPLSVVRLGGGFGTGDTASLSGVYYDNLRIERVEAPEEDGALIELSDKGSCYGICSFPSALGG